MAEKQASASEGATTDRLSGLDAAGAPAEEQDRMQSKERAVTPPTASKLSSRAREVRKNEVGEEVTVPGRAEQVFRETAKSQAPPANTGSGDRVVKPRPSPFAQGQAAPRLESELGASDAPRFAKDTAAPGTHRVCGTVRDPRGRPVPGALVAVAEAGRSVTANADGSFCIDAPVGRASLTALAIGFETTRLALDDASAGPLAVVITPVSAVGPPATSYRFDARDPRAAPEQKALALATDPFEGETPATRAEIARARQQVTIATRDRSASAWEQAAGDWARVLARVRGASSGDEARFRIAEARYRAWEASPDANRALRAEESLTSFLVRAPLGPQRDQASRWAQQLSH